MLVISSLILQNSKIILNLCGLFEPKNFVFQFYRRAQIVNFIIGLERQQKALLLLGEAKLPFDQATATLTTRFLSTAVSKIYRLMLERLRELQAPWLTN